MLLCLDGNWRHLDRIFPRGFQQLQVLGPRSRGLDSIRYFFLRVGVSQICIVLVVLGCDLSCSVLGLLPRRGLIRSLVLCVGVQLWLVLWGLRVLRKIHSIGRLLLFSSNHIMKHSSYEEYIMDLKGFLDKKNLVLNLQACSLYLHRNKPLHDPQPKQTKDQSDHYSKKHISPYLDAQKR